MAEAQDYRDTRRQSWLLADQSAITLATTQKALWTPALTKFPPDFWTLGRMVKLTAFTKMVTDGTAGNYVFAMAYGSGDAPAPIVVTASAAGVVSKTFGMYWQGYAVCRSVGSAGTLSMWGHVFPDLTGMLSTVQPLVFPTAASTVVSTIDTTAGTNALTFQAQRSGAGVWTAALVGLDVEVCN